MIHVAKNRRMRAKKIIVVGLMPGETALRELSDQMSETDDLFCSLILMYIPTPPPYLPNFDVGASQSGSKYRRRIFGHRLWKVVCSVEHSNESVQTNFRIV